jgi:hypothetical protein
MLSKLTTAAPPVNSRSEHQFGPELDHTRGYTLHAAADGTEGCRIDITVERRRIRIEMIRQVEDFRPEFE